MRLVPKEQDKLMLHYAGMLARDRRAQGLKLNYPEAVAYISMEVMEHKLILLSWNKSHYYSSYLYSIVYLLLFLCKGFSYYSLRVAYEHSAEPYDGAECNNADS